MTSGIAESMEVTARQEEQERHDWAADYDGTVCPNCNRERMMRCNNGRRICEKCNFDPDTNEYSDCPDHVRN